MFALTDAMPIDYPDHLSIIKGDAKVSRLVGASILAKVTRDRLMEAYALEYPEYGFEKQRICYSAIKKLWEKYEALSIHRKSFGPSKDIIKTDVILILMTFLIFKSNFI